MFQGGGAYHTHGSPTEENPNVLGVKGVTLTEGFEAGEYEAGFPGNNLEDEVYKGNGEPILVRVHVLVTRRNPGEITTLQP